MFANRQSDLKPKGYYVYLHRRCTDGIVFYVGKGKGSRAWNSWNRSDYWTNIARKHGVIVDIYKDRMTEDRSYLVEEELISRFDSEHLCNISTGGVGGKSGCSIGTVYSSNGMSFDSAEHAASWLVGEGFSYATGSQINACCRGQRKTAYGLSWSRSGPNPEFIKPHNSSKSVLCSNGMKFESIKSAARWAASHTGKHGSPTAISKCCQGKSYSAFGYNWEFESSGIFPNAEKPKRKKSHKPTPVVCSTGRKFNDITDAVEWLKSNGFPKASGSNIHKCIQGNLNSAYGFSWSQY